MKVIDLLNKMANDKNYRPTVKFLTATYKYNEKMKDYESNISSDRGIFSDYTINNILNDEVELIEDETIDIDNIEKLATGYSESGADTDIINYINDKIVPGIKQLNKRVKELEELNIEISEKEINEAIKKAREQINKEIKSIKEEMYNENDNL